MTLHDKLTIDALLPGYLAICARREFEAALAAQQAAIEKMASITRQTRIAAAMAAADEFWNRAES